MCLCSRGTSARVCGHIYRLYCCRHPRKIIFPITLSCYKNKVPAWRVKMKAIIILKISPIFICQRYAIDGLFEEFDICFVVFTETFLVLFFFRPLLQQQSRLFSSRGFLFFLDNPKIIQMLSILGEKLGQRKKKKTVTKSTHKYRQNRWGVDVRPQLHVRRRVLPLHLLRVSFPLPSKVSDEYSGKC